MEVEEYYNGYQLGIDIWHNKYQNNGETFDNYLDRVSIDDWDIRESIVEQKFLFGGRILANRGISKHVSYSNCYFLPRPNDNLESIYDIAGKLSKVYSVGGGGGIDLSLLAPRGAVINNAAKVTSGAVSFAELYNTTTALIGQDGRRGALMLSIDDSHLDLEEFITAKSEDGKLEKSNLSVKFYDVFMHAAIQNDMITHSHTRNGVTLSKDINPHGILRTLAAQAHEWSEPGALFWDRVQSWNAMSEYADFILTGINPCGEIPLPEGGACLLGSVVLSQFVYNTEFDYLEFERNIRLAVRGLNVVLDEGIERHPLTLQSEVAEKFRQIGLGTMAYADMLIKLEMCYGNDDALKMTDSVSAFMCDTAFNESALLAKEFGPFPGYDREATLNSEFIHVNVSKQTFELISKYGLRNATILGIAPTGTLSTMIDVSGGIEPIYALEYNRKTESLHSEDVIYKVQPKIVREYMEEHNIDNIEDLPEWFITAKNIDPFKRIQTQSIWQRHIDSAISSTINLPFDATPEDIYNIYIAAWKNGLKGVTVHREGNRREGVLTEGLTHESEVEHSRGDWQPIADDTVYHKRKVYTGCGQINLFIGYSELNNRIEDLYVKRSGIGSGCTNNIDSFIIAASGMLRLGGSFDNIKQALQGVGSCNSFVRAKMSRKKLSKGANCATAILNTIESFSRGEELPLHIQSKIIDIVSEPNKSKCPECSADLIFTSGCVECRSCGFSKCD